MMPVYQKSLGDTVRKARHKAKLSQAELAEVLGIGLRTVGDIENYRSNLTMETLYPLIRTLNIDPADIFYPDPALQAGRTGSSRSPVQPPAHRT